MSLSPVGEVRASPDPTSLPAVGALLVFLLNATDGIPINRHPASTAEALDRDQAKHDVTLNKIFIVGVSFTCPKVIILYLFQMNIF